MSLKDALMEINGVGDARADEILDVLEAEAAEHGVDGSAIMDELELAHGHLERAGYERSADLSRAFEAIEFCLGELRAPEGDESEA